MFSAFMIWATRRSSFVKSSNCIDFMFSIDLFGISCLLGFGFSSFVNRTGAFLIVSVLKIWFIFSADSGMNGDRSLAISLMLSASWYKSVFDLVSHGFLCWMNSLQWSMNVNISLRALSILYSLKC